MQAKPTTRAVSTMACAFQEEIAPQGGIELGSSVANALWTAENIASLLGPQQSMSNQLAMHFAGNRASSSSPVVGTILGLDFNGKHVHRLACMIAAVAAAAVLTQSRHVSTSIYHSPYCLALRMLCSESTQANVCLVQVRQNSTPAAAT